MLIMSSILHLGKSGLATKAITNDDTDRIFFCLKTLSQRSPDIVEIFKTACRDALASMLKAHSDEEEAAQKSKSKKTVKVQPDDPITFAQLSNNRNDQLGENVFESSLNQALAGTKGTGLQDYATPMGNLNKVTQLTGFSDPVYAEAYVHVNQYDIVLDVLVVNQTSKRELVSPWKKSSNQKIISDDTLQNCTLELATVGDLKLVERPQPVVLAPLDFCNIKATVKVSSTENGIIFGNIVYDTSNSSNVVILNSIHIDIMDYILPASCNDTEFRTMWIEFEWENKVSVNTTITNLHEYLKFILKSTNMKCLTPEKAISGECGFMAANLYARSIFGEDALANLSIEKPFDRPEAPVTGHIRIRAKSQVGRAPMKSLMWFSECFFFFQGMALSLGDKINNTQKGLQLQDKK